MTLSCQLSGTAPTKPFSLSSDSQGCLGHWEPLKRQEQAGTVPSAATRVLTDKSGRLFKSIEDCANTTIRGLLTLIRPRSRRNRRTGHIGCEDGARSCGTQVPSREREAASCLTTYSQAYYIQGVHPPSVRVWLESR